MKKLIYLLPVLFFASCSPSFGGGGFVVPLITGLGAVIFGAIAYKSQNYNVLKNGYALACLVCVAATIIIIIAMAAAK